MNIAFFDFDGTLTVKDSFLSFLLYSQKKGTFIIKSFFLLPILLALKLKLLTNSKAKEIVFTTFFKGKSHTKIQQTAKAFTAHKIPGLLRPYALNILKDHIENGDKIIIVTASLNTWLDNWCSDNNFDLIATKAEVKNGILTGKFENANNYGKEKAIQIKNRYNLSAYNTVYAYGDSRGDSEMLMLAHKSYMYNKKENKFILINTQNAV